MLDWSDGDYALTAAALAPVTERVLDVAGVDGAQRVLDVACGTGAAALAAGRRGAAATGVDPAIGLLEIARARAAKEQLHVEFLGGDANALPVPEASFDVCVSVFGVIFAPDPSLAITEMLRAVRPAGCVALSSWLRGGAVDSAAGILRDALTTPRPSPEAEPPEPPAWQDPAWISGLLEACGGREVTLVEDALRFDAVSPEAWFAEQEEHHPVWRSGRTHLDEGTWADVRRRSLDVLHEQNEDSEAFAATSRYVIARALR
jgi:SAM-dependent methyltransferase